MTAQALYNQFIDGDISKETFLYEVRRNNTPYITKSNSFEDTINILKNRRVIFEEKYREDKNVVNPKQEIKTIDQVSPHEYAKGLDYELDLMDKSVGQNTPTWDEIQKAQTKVLTNLAKDDYFYTRKIMSDVEKKQEKGNLRPEELGKKMTAPNQMEKGKVLKENMNNGFEKFKKMVIIDFMDDINNIESAEDEIALGNKIVDKYSIDFSQAMKVIESVWENEISNKNLNEIEKDKFTKGDKVIMTNINNGKKYEVEYIDSINGIPRYKDIKTGDWIQQGKDEGHWKYSLKEGVDNDQDYKSQLDKFLQDPDGDGFGIYGYTNVIHDIMTGQDEDFAPEDIDDYLEESKVSMMIIMMKILKKQ